MDAALKILKDDLVPYSCERIETLSVKAIRSILKLVPYSCERIETNLNVL